MEHVVRSLPLPCAGSGALDLSLRREWLVTNGLGGYASGTVCGVATRRYHGWLIAALPSPLGRTILLNRLGERLGFPDGSSAAFGVEAIATSPGPSSSDGGLVEFRLEDGRPVWRFAVEGRVLEKTVLLPHLQNTVFITYRLLSVDESAQLILRPSVHFRSHDAAVDGPHPGPYLLTASEDRYELASGYEIPPLRMTVRGKDAAFTLDASATTQLNYAIEQSRGYDHTGDLWSPGFFRVELAQDSPVTLVASTETWETLSALTPDEALRAEQSRRSRLLAMAKPEARQGVGAELVLAADQFLMTPAGRVEDATRAHAAGEEIRSIIAGYHWFTDWGRDTMISLEGLCLTTGRQVEAGYILRTFASCIRDGLIPNLFPEAKNQGLYHTADATLWFFHAIERYLEATRDREILSFLLPRLVDILDHHLKGTRFGIGVDPRDGLLRQGQEGYQLTWMDAKVGDWVVTPRRGKAVEINALWYNALRLLEGWLREAGDNQKARQVAEHAERTRRSFHERFWYEPGGYLYDVIDGEQGDDPACRPNQVFAISLRHPILDRSRWRRVLDVVRERLVTPVGLRSLAPGHPDFKARYDGDLRARDAAYHQGTVWTWLIGPFIDAWLKLDPDDRDGARRFLDGLIPHLDEAGIGTISEIFDAEPPYSPRGCIAQAWSVAEVLRSWVKTGERRSSASV
jgi:predicted glycogen debranching enzyme